MACGKTLTFCLLVFVAGCGSYDSDSSVSGTITYQGAPLNSGQIYFTINRGEAVRSAPIEPDGTYFVKDLVVGEAQLAVVVPPAYQAVTDDPAAPTFDGRLPTDVNPVVIPKRYSEISTSSLTLTVAKGQQSHNIDLK